MKKIRLGVCLSLVLAACQAAELSRGGPGDGRDGRVWGSDARFDRIVLDAPNAAADGPPRRDDLMRPDGGGPDGAGHRDGGGARRDTAVPIDSFVQLDRALVRRDIAIARDMTTTPIDSIVRLDTASPIDSYVPVDSGSSGPCTIFPANNPWNTNISSYPVHANSANFVASIGAGGSLKADFGTTYQGAPNGIPYIKVTDPNQPRVPVTFVDYADESDPGPYPIPPNAPIEGGPNSSGDRHVIVVDMAHCMLYELFNAHPNGSGWQASNGAAFDMRSNTLRPMGWTSADAAGLPVFPGLVNYDEVQSGAIRHALRFTVVNSQRAIVLPATHWASSSTNTNRPPMGLRFRLKASFDISSFSATNRVILTALKTYGMIVADNGANWYLSGAPSASWDDNDLRDLGRVKGSDFEVVDTGPILTSYP